LKFPAAGAFRGRKGASHLAVATQFGSCWNPEPLPEPVWQQFRTESRFPLFLNCSTAPP